MSKTSIEWTRGDDGAAGQTWNPIAGCSLVSPGCTNCYAMRQAHRLEHNFKQLKYAGTTQKINGQAVWTGKINLNEAALEIPLKRKKPTRFFVNSMSDLFHEGVPYWFIDRVLEVIAACPQHVFLVLTKRADRMERCLYEVTEEHPCRELGGGDYLPNLWLGVSAEDQQRADERIPWLLKMPAAVRFLSCEPLLGPISFISPHGVPLWWNGKLNPLSGIHWVIVGAESGPGARLCDVGWIRSIVAQCKAAGVKCFVKQVGSNSSLHGILDILDSKGGDPSEWPPDLRVREFPECG